jgi:hypothetical protein
MKTHDMDRLRDVILGLSEGGKRTISNVLLYQTLGLTDEPSKKRLLRQIQDMTVRGELVRLGPGELRYEPQAPSNRYGKLYERIWRVIRAKQPGFSVQDIALTTGAGENHAYKYLRWLEKQGYLRRHGKSGNTALYMATTLARSTRETPYPPLGVGDPFEAERNSACHLVRLLMERDPADQKAKIVQNCRAILDRFETTPCKGKEAS